SLGKALVQLSGIVRGVVLAVAVFGGILEHLVAYGEADGVGLHVLFGKAWGVETFSGGIHAGAHIYVVGKLGHIVQIKRIPLVVTIQAGAIIVDPIPVGNVVPALRVVAGERPVVGWQAIRYHNTKRSLETIVDGADVLPSRGVRALVRRHAS